MAAKVYQDLYLLSNTQKMWNGINVIWLMRQAKPLKNWTIRLKEIG
jgi:hypothetical protein